MGASWALVEGNVLSVLVVRAGVAARINGAGRDSVRLVVANDGVSLRRAPTSLTSRSPEDAHAHSGRTER